MQRDTAETFNTANLATLAVPSTTTNPYSGTIAFHDTVVPTGQVFYRVAAVDDFTPSNPLNAPFRPVPLASTWSNTASIGIIGVPFASVSPALLTFGSVAITAASAPQTITVSNTGTGSFDITGVAPSGVNSGDFSVNSFCSLTLAAPVPPATSSCTISVAFTPTVGGAESASLIINTNDPAHPTPNGPGNGNGWAAVADDYCRHRHDEVWQRGSDHYARLQPGEPSRFDGTNLYDDGDQHKSGGNLSNDLLGSNVRQLPDQLCGRGDFRNASAIDDLGRQRHDGVRRHGSDHHAQFRGICGRRYRSELDDAAHLHHNGERDESAESADLPELLFWGGRSELHD